MNTKHSLIAVEGSHDQAFISKILVSLFNFQDFSKSQNNQLKTIDPFWKKFVPKYPPQSGKLYLRLNMPSILYTETHSVAIYCGGGSTLKKGLSKIILNNSHFQTDLSAFAIIIDADKKTPQSLTQEYSDTFQQYYPNFPTQAGIVSTASPQTGIYILPDNQNQGVLETILLKCGEIAYPEYLEKAQDYIAEIKKCPKKYYKWKPFDEEKAIIATIVSILKPSKTNTVSISDNKWISEQTYQSVTELYNFVEFLKTLLNLP